MPEQLDHIKIIVCSPGVDPPLLQLPNLQEAKRAKNGFDVTSQNST